MKQRRVVVITIKGVAYPVWFTYYRTYATYVKACS